MNEINGKWIMEGLSKDDPNCIRSMDELIKYINKVGFLPLFKNSIPGFSVEEITDKDAWWGENPLEDPWEWRGRIAEQGEIAYGKLFSKKAGFVSKEWYPVFCNYRRDGYDFDTRYEEGLAGRKSQLLMEVLEQHNEILSSELKNSAGFGKAGEKGFDTGLTTLQMQTYVTVKRFQKKRNKQNEEYGWAVAVYCLPEMVFGTDYVRSCYSENPLLSKEKIISKISRHFPNSTSEEIEKFMK
ncbi:AlkZ-related protein [Anaeromicropila populeti]|uniref:Uncharacterized protein n=1 Tax=Anaeromicropila populeti TaxID=37658 RepID=A0A1I6IRF8_9FIRM|nr:hypothetical protein [Anaeromicropila populeti]SFR69336.1 hypothetical protein SAMN05661086_01085 [Anaeromicropila populeti]